MHETDGDLEVNLLGPVEIRRDGAPLDVGGPLQRAVIAQLALDVGRVVSVERLIQRVWGEEPPATPLGTLQSYVSRLRRLLEPQRSAGSPARVLASEAPGYVLRLEPLQVDVARFEAAAAAGRDAAARGHHEAAVERFDAALAVWRGPALGGIGPDDEVAPIVLRLDEARWAVEEDRVDSLLALGRHVEAIAPLQAATAELPLRERRWAQLALALYRSRRQADALRAIAAARDHLVGQLGLDPGPELRELERQILDQDPSLLATPALTPMPAAPADDHPAAAVTVVGRTNEWAAMHAALARAGAGRTGLLLVEGEPGIGKSTMLGALAAEARSSGWMVSAGRCAEPGLAPTLWPWVEIARAQVASGGAGDPALSGLLSHNAAGSAALVSLVELAERIAALFRASAEGAPQLAVIDDLHWADAPTLDLVTLVVERVPDARLLVAAGHRPADLVIGSPFASSLATLTRVPGITRLRLPGLDSAEVGRLMTLVTGAEPTGAVAELVCGRTAGNPLFVAELARLAGAGGVSLTDVVPDAVRDVVRRRLADLPQPTTDLLAVAAVIGEDVDIRLVAAASTTGLDETLDALDAAIVTRVLVPAEDGAYRFAHALVRDAVLAELSPLRRDRLHLRAAEAIESVSGADLDHSEPIASHRLAAGTIDDPIRVAAAATLAADVARLRSAYEQSQWWLEQALAAARRAPTGTGRASAELSALESWLTLETATSFMSGDLGSIADRIEQLGIANDSDPMQQLATFTRWSVINTDGPIASAEHRDVAVRRAERSASPYTQAVGFYVGASQALFGGDVESARRYFDLAMAAEDRSLAADPPLNVPVPMIAGFSALADELALDSTRTDELFVRQQQSLDKRRDDVRVDGAFVRALAAAVCDDAPTVADATAIADDVRVRVPHFSAACEVLRCWAAVANGEEAAPALARGQAAMAEFDEGPTTIGVPAFRTFFGAALLAVGDDRALAVLRRAASDAVDTGDVWWRPETLRLLALAEVTFGDSDLATGLLEEAGDAADRQGAALIADRVRATIDSIESTRRHPS